MRRVPGTHGTTPNLALQRIRPPERFLANRGLFSAAR
jgi:hypothetical protein